MVLFFSRDTQRNGLIVVYDMSAIRWINSDMKLARHLLDILKVQSVHSSFSETVNFESSPHVFDMWSDHRNSRSDIPLMSTWAIFDI